MPYIDEADRKWVDKEIGLLAGKIYGQWGRDKRAGVLNYCICRLIMSSITPYCYDDVNRIMGILTCVQHEIYRRVAVPYEDRKRRETGDLAEFKEDA